ncbi:MAG: TetR/AcrR family transcriptional regulator, partial [Oscillospiraceae bacterium]
MAEQKTSVDKVISTKGKIIFKSLNLFSQQGYEGVSMRDIAAAVGIKGASIYNHFKGKEDIFNAIIKEMSKRYENTSQTIDVPNGDMSEVTKTYMEISHESLQQIASGLF